MRTFQTKFFVAALSAAVLALTVAGALFATTMRRQIDRRIESTLVAEARLAAELIARGTPLSTVPELDDEADRIGQLIGARTTFIAPDGTVVELLDSDEGSRVLLHRAGISVPGAADAVAEALALPLAPANA